MDSEGQEEAYEAVIDTLIGMFGDVLSRDVISVVVESCNGDLNIAADAVMNISSDIVTTNEINIESASQSIESPQDVTQSIPESQSNISSEGITSDCEVISNSANPSFSTLSISKKTGAVPKKLAPARTLTINVWTEQIQRILANHNEGNRILILMRGVPGSGKSYLAKQIVEMTIGSSFVNYQTHICSTDDYFIARAGYYQYNVSKLSEAHDWNQQRVKQALEQGLSPMIIDNTNTQLWEMKPYVLNGVLNGYIIEVIEPNTTWARKASQLAIKNSHNVPFKKIVQMLDRYQDWNGTSNDLLKYFDMSYPPHLMPPVVRMIPEVAKHKQDKSIPITKTLDTVNISKINLQVEKLDETCQNSPDILKPPVFAQLINLTPTNEIKEPINTEQSWGDKVKSPETNDAIIQNRQDEEKSSSYLEIQKQIEEIEKVEQEWENGETWEDLTQETACALSNKGTEKATLLDNIKKCEDWSQISLFMPVWLTDNTFETHKNDEIPVETISRSTCMEIGDAKNKIFKVITGRCLDINKFLAPLTREKIPEKQLLHKSTMTNELILGTEVQRCKNEEQHFIAFRKMFRNLPRAALRDVFDNCHGDVNWAVGIILDSISNNELSVEENDLSNDEDEKDLEPCNCIAAYHIAPDTNVLVTNKSSVESEKNIPESTSALLQPKKPKYSHSENTIQIKRKIEQNIVIPDNHYPQYSLKIMKMRRGDTSPFEKPLEGAVETNYKTNDSDDESTESSVDFNEKTVNIMLGMDFVKQLDELFGRQNTTYDSNIVPRINIPLNLLNQLNAFWIESLMYQLDDQDKHKSRMMREDEEFARQLHNKENELALEGKEPEVPNFKEIMDMDYALDLHQREVTAEWKNKEPQDIAAKLSRNKLYNLFPDMRKDTLSELLVAHDNNFLATVEVLLMSTGKGHLLTKKNGVNEFVMKNEIMQKEKLMEEEKKALSEVEWPLLQKGTKIDMSTVDNYRTQAEKHLRNRNLSYQKAQDYIRRGMTQVANFYSDVASYHKTKYEQANSFAAMALMQLHAEKHENTATIDLHFMRVAEAKEMLDIYLDTHINKLKQAQGKGIYKSQILYFITGRGLHSHAGPRIKPAVRRRLRQRGLTCYEGNPGLLFSTVTADDKLSHEIRDP